MDHRWGSGAMLSRAIPFHGDRDTSKSLQAIASLLTCLGRIWMSVACSSYATAHLKNFLQTPNTAKDAEVHKNPATSFVEEVRRYITSHLLHLHSLTRSCPRFWSPKKIEIGLLTVIQVFKTIFRLKNLRRDTEKSGRPERYPVSAPQVSFPLASSRLRRQPLDMSQSDRITKKVVRPVASLSVLVKVLYIFITSAWLLCAQYDDDGSLERYERRS